MGDDIVKIKITKNLMLYKPASSPNERDIYRPVFKTDEGKYLIYPNENYFDTRVMEVFKRGRKFYTAEQLEQLNQR